MQNWASRFSPLAPLHVKRMFLFRSQVCSLHGVSRRVGSASLRSGGGGGGKGEGPRQDGSWQRLSAPRQWRHLADRENKGSGVAAQMTAHCTRGGLFGSGTVRTSLRRLRVCCLLSWCKQLVVSLYGLTRIFAATKISRCRWLCYMYRIFKDQWVWGGRCQAAAFAWCFEELLAEVVVQAWMCSWIVFVRGAIARVLKAGVNVIPMSFSLNCN